MSEATSNDSNLYGLLGRFRDVETLIVAIRTLRSEGYTEFEAFSPYPVEELNEALGVRSRWLTVVTLIASLAAAAGTYWMVWYSAAVDYPFVVGGKPLHSWPPFALIAFVLAILSAVVTAFLGMLCGNRLPRLYHPAFNITMFERASNDAFFLLTNVGTLTHDEIESLRSRLQNLGAEDVQEVPP